MIHKHRSIIIRLLCMLLVLLQLSLSGIAEPSVLQGLDLSANSMELTLKAGLDVMLPFDSVRTGWLNSLLQYTDMQLRWHTSQQTDWTQLSLLVNHSPALSLTLCENASGSQLETSLLPGASYTLPAGEKNALDLLMGSDSTQVTLWGIDPNQLQLLPDAEQSVLALIQSGVFTAKKKAESVSGFGETSQTLTWTCAEADANFRQTLLTAVSDGYLHQLLNRLTFTGKQAITVLATSEGIPHKVSYTGSCGTDADHMLKVTLSWKLARKDTMVRDTLNVKASSASGKNSVSLILTRMVKPDKTGKITEVVNATRDIVRNGKKDHLTAELSLVRANETLTGTIQLSHSGTDNTRESIMLKPELTIGNAAEPLSGNVGFTVKESGTPSMQGNLQLTLKNSAPLVPQWSPAVALDQLDAVTLQQLQTDLTNHAATSLVAHWITLPRDATLYLSQDLSDDLWMTLGLSAMSLTEEEE